MKKRLLIAFIVCLSSLAFAQDEQRGRPGIPVDKYGGATIDPTKNVLDLVNAAVKRLDDLAALDKELHDVRIADLKELGALRAQHETELRKSEAARLDAIRQVDLENVTKTANTLAKQVTDTANAAEARFSAFQAETNKRLSQLELSASERAGKSTATDPELIAGNRRRDELLEKLVAAQANNQGQSRGTANLLTMLIAGGVLVVSAASFWRSRQNGKILRNGRK